MSTKRKTYSRSTSRSLAPKRLQFSRTMRTRALVAPSVGLGMSATTVLRTSFFANITSAGTGIWTGYLSPGSCFDPCGDITTLQPQLYDQWALVYSRYKVNSATVRIKITGTASPNPVWVGAGYPAVDPTALTTYQGAASQQYSKTTSGGFQVVGPPGSQVGTGTEGKYLSFKLNHNQVVGAKSDTWDVGALVTANPTALQYMVLPMFLQASGAGAATWVLEIDVWQNVTFSQKKNPVDL